MIREVTTKVYNTGNHKGTCEIQRLPAAPEATRAPAASDPRAECWAHFFLPKGHIVVFLAERQNGQPSPRYLLNHSNVTTSEWSHF